METRDVIDVALFVVGTIATAYLTVGHDYRRKSLKLDLELFALLRKDGVREKLTFPNGFEKQLQEAVMQVLRPAPPRTGFLRPAQGVTIAVGTLFLALARLLGCNAAPFWLAGVLGLYLVAIGLLDVVWCASSWFRGTALGRAFDRRILLLADRPGQRWVVAFFREEEERSQGSDLGG